MAVPHPYSWRLFLDAMVALLCRSCAFHLGFGALRLLSGAAEKPAGTLGKLTLFVMATGIMMETGKPMTLKEDYVFEQMESGDVCVFPSEVASRGWLISYARKRKAIFADKAISYDAFCKLFINPGNRIKATSMIRYQFLFDAIATKKLSLPYFIPRPERATPRLISYLASLLPQLKLFHDQGRDLYQHDC